MKLRDKCALLVLFVVTGQPVSAQSCDKNCPKIRQLIAVMGATMEGCGKAFPDHKEQFSAAFKNWKLLKYHIPGLQDLLTERTPELQQARVLVAQDFLKSPKEEQGIQCSGYGAALVHQELFLPPEMLAGYAQNP